MVQKDLSIVKKHVAQVFLIEKLHLFNINFDIHHLVDNILIRCN